MGFRGKNRSFGKYKNRSFERQRRRKMENLVVNAEEHKMLKKYHKYLESQFNVRICMPISKSQHSDVIFLSLEGAEYNRNHVKNFLANKMQESSKFQSPSDDNVTVITLSDSDSESDCESDSDLSIINRDAGQAENSNQTIAPQKIHDASIFQIEPSNSSNLQTVDIPVSTATVSKKIHDVSIYEIDSTSSSNLQTLNIRDSSESDPRNFMSSLTVQKRKGKKRKAKAMKVRSGNEMSTSETVDSSEISSTTDNSVVTKKAKLSDSVIIIEEPERSSKPCLDFIPLTSRTESVNQVNKHAHKSFSSKQKNKNNEPGTSKMDLDFIPLISGKDNINQNNEQANRSSNSTSKDSNHIDTIIINESESTATPRRLRPIVIDGSNIAMEHGKTTHSFSVKGIKIAIDYFLNRGHTQVTAFVPKFRRNTNPNRNYPTTNGELFDELENRQQVVFTPSRRINGKQISSYDDRFIVELAVSNGGVIVSNDNYRDLMEESETFKEVIEQRLLMFLFVGDVFMVPDDPLGRSGPRLIDYLSFLPEVEKKEEKEKEEN